MPRRAAKTSVRRYDRPLVHEVTYSLIGMTLGLTAQRKPRLPVEESGVLLDVRKVFQAGAGFLVLLVHAPGDEQQDCTQDRERGSNPTLNQTPLKSRAASTAATRKSAAAPPSFSA